MYDGVNLHVQCPLGLGRLLWAAVADQRTALGQAQVEGEQRAVLHADGPQSGAVDLHKHHNNVYLSLSRSLSHTQTRILPVRIQVLMCVFNHEDSETAVQHPFHISYWLLSALPDCSYGPGHVRGPIPLHVSNSLKSSLSIDFM